MSTTLELVFGGVAPAFLDDAERTPQCQNGKPAIASIVAKEISLLNQVTHAGHPIYTFAPGGFSPNLTIAPATEITSCYRQVYMPVNKGATTEGGEILAVIHTAEGSPGFQTSQGIDVSIGSQTSHTYWNFSTAASFDFPDNMTALPFAASYGYSTKPAEVIIGGVTSNWPRPLAGTIWQDPVNSVDSAKASTAGSADVHSKGEIIAVRGTGVEQLTSLINVFRDSWFHQRPQGGWSTCLPGQLDPSTSTSRGIHFTTSTTQFRYIFDQTYGGNGTTITATSPAITLPLHHAGAGLSTQVRVYPFVYAAMSGTTNNGSIGVANKDSGGTMTAPAALTVPSGGSSPTITGTTFQWYPALSTWSNTTSAYFMGYTGSAFDRVALCAKSTGTTDHVIIGAFTLVVAPATT